MSNDKVIFFTLLVDAAILLVLALNTHYTYQLLREQKYG
jgi:hypothetical protein